MNFDKEKRLLLASVLAMAFLFVWSSYVKKNSPVTAQEKNGNVSAPISQASSSPVLQVPQNVAPVASNPALVDQLFETEHDALKITWNLVGGAPVKIQLKNFKQSKEASSPLVEVFPFNQNSVRPMHLSVVRGTQFFNDFDFVFTKENGAANELVFVANIDSTLQLKKIYQVSAGAPYQVRCKVIFSNKSNVAQGLLASWSIEGLNDLVPKSGIRQMFGARDENQIRFSGLVADKSFHKELDSVVGETSPSGFIDWLGFESQYFLSALVPSSGNFERFELLRPSKTLAHIKAYYPQWSLAPSSSLEVSLDLFQGPKQKDILVQTKASLEKAIDLGDWLGVIARPIQSLLKAIYSVVGNYGWAIIFLTVLVRLAMWPLSRMQMNSMKKMQEHKPYLDSLKERYGDDKEGYSREMMNYMRTNKINPMGGCLLLLPQLPIFFSLYRVIFNSVELRHAPFMAWIQNLSSYDPYFILPVILGVAMYFQQKLTPSPGVDPSQQAMMKIMPVLFTSFMLFLPAGLNLYILVSTLWGVAQQVWMTRSLSTSALVKTVEAERQSRG